MTRSVDRAVTEMLGGAAPPRRNGELVFDAPWQGRAFGMALVVVERLGVSWSEFQRRLIGAIADRPEAPYYDCWIAALEQLVIDHGIASPAEIDRAEATTSRESRNPDEHG